MKRLGLFMTVIMILCITVNAQKQSKGTDVRQERNRQQGSLFTGISISAAFLPVVQEACGLYTE